MAWKESFDNETAPYASLNYQDEKGLYLFGGTNYLPGILLIVPNTSNQSFCYASNTNTNAQILCKHICHNNNLIVDGGWQFCRF